MRELLLLNLLCCKRCQPSTRNSQDCQCSWSWALKLGKARNAFHKWRWLRWERRWCDCWDRGLRICFIWTIFLEDCSTQLKFLIQETNFQLLKEHKKCQFVFCYSWKESQVRTVHPRTLLQYKWIVIFQNHITESQDIQWQSLLSRRKRKILRWLLLERILSSKRRNCKWTSLQGCPWS